ncbi:hypothetical protein THAR02_08625 [Trichoderma harzianum]|uniref:Uncharacterized protein n=1 Tax=Trichoderma harzianum TaxID=5544 RepID=A0A0F9X220_TRIHA|nr:hypothetical protein THAR02_08625 [Trichoderma harzianum]
MPRASETPVPQPDGGEDSQSPISPIWLAAIERLSKEIHTAEAVAALKGLHALRIDGVVKLPCFAIPFGLNLRFFVRADELRTLTEALDPTRNSTRLRAIGIHGLGGVGKSQLALQYANTSMNVYEMIAWIPAETEITLVQGLSRLASKLELTDGTSEDDNQSVQKVKDWLNTAKKPFLVIFDNVDKIELLDQIWPASDKGSIIITTRSPSLASKRVATTMALGCFSAEVGKDVLRSMTGIEPADDDNEAALGEICRFIGGLPLAMVQISDFTRDRGYSYAEFLRIYEKSAEKVLAKSEPPVAYDQTLLTTWDISLQKLSAEATRLQSLLVFFDPDLIPERLITNTKAGIEVMDLDFLFDDFEFPKTWQDKRCSSRPWMGFLGNMQRNLTTCQLANANIREAQCQVNYAGCLGRVGFQSWNQALALREKIEARDSPPIAEVCDSIACGYTEAGDVEHALKYLEKAAAIHNAYDPSSISRTLAIRAMTCLRAGQAKYALDAIRECWRMQNMTQDQIEQSKYPKHSRGSGARVAHSHDAERYLRRARGPRVADSLFTVANMLRDGGELVLAAQLVSEIINISGNAPAMRSHLARALWFSAAVESEIGGDEAKVADQRRKARERRSAIQGREWPDEDSDESFMRLVSWMLW